MGFQKAEVYDYEGAPDPNALLAVMLRGGQQIYLAPSFRDLPLPTPYHIPAELLPKWLQEWYDHELAEDLVGLKYLHYTAPFPKDHTQATGVWSIQVRSRRLCPNEDLHLVPGRSNRILTIPASDIVCMMPTDRRSALAYLAREVVRPQLQPAHS
jgi:hypothetical protein